jgi:dienelactone hydrolase
MLSGIPLCGSLPLCIMTIMNKKIDILSMGLALGMVFGACAADSAGLARILEENVLDESLAGGPPTLMMYRLLSAEMAQAGVSIRATQDRIITPEALAVWQKRTRGACLEALGGFPERTPLNARVLATVEREGYRIEKLLCESRPQHFVTAHLFLPDPTRFAAPYPGILIACGHSKTGKGYPGYQRGALLAAYNGMAALIYDPIDQGERLQGVGKGLCIGHNTTGVKAALLGWNTATFRIWDGMRAMDYLASRPEVDDSRLGCMGNSGGGTLSTYLSALDERIKAAAPSCYISSLQHVCAAMGPQDAEQNVFGQMAFGLEHSGWLLLRAPAATCVCAAKKDMFPIEGTYQTIGEVRAVYERLGKADRLELAEHDGPHGWAEPLKVAAVRFMSRWLRQGAEVTVPPETDMGLKDEAVNVTEQGQVMKLDGARSVYDLMRDEAARLVFVRGLAGKRDLHAVVRRLAGIRSLENIPVPVTVNRASVLEGEVSVRKVALTVEGRVAIPADLFTPAMPHGAPVLVVDGRGKRHVAATVSALLKEGRTVLAADLSGFGETYGSAHSFYGAKNKDEGPAVMAYLLGHSLVGQRAEDVLLCARWLSTACGENRVELHASEWAVTPALHAAVAEPQLFSKVTLADEPLPWEDVVTKDVSHRFSDVVHGALREYTLADLKALAVR